MCIARGGGGGGVRSSLTKGWLKILFLLTSIGTHLNFSMTQCTSEINTQRKVK